jgi:predicted nucleic acid-binding protein
VIVCVDASLVLKLLTWEHGSDQALQWLESWAEERIIAPQFLPVEVASVLRRKMRRNEIPAGHCIESLGLLDRLAIKYVWDAGLLDRAFALAVELDQPTVYDTAYLALAERERCELWTADARFVAAASARYPFVRCLLPA